MKPGDKIIIENTMCYSMNGGDLVPVKYAVVTIMRLISLPGRKDVIFQSPFWGGLLRTAAKNAMLFEQREKPATNMPQSAEEVPAREATV